MNGFSYGALQAMPSVSHSKNRFCLYILTKYDINITCMYIIFVQDKHCNVDLQIYTG